MKSICLISNDYEEQDILIHAFKRTNFQLFSLSNTKQLAEQWSDKPCDIVLFMTNKTEYSADITMLQQSVSVPIAVICEPISESEQIELLKQGAIRLWFRPYSVRLLVHQVTILIAYTSGITTRVIENIKMGGLTLYADSHTVQVGDAEPCRLTNREFNLLYKLLKNPHRTLTYEQIVEAIWGNSTFGDSKLVRNLVYQLRRKIDPDNKLGLIITEQNVGYRFTP